jgi:predicted alpha/beta hydrolase
MNENIKVLAWDGYGLSAIYFKPVTPNGRVILINSATGVKQTFYQDFAAYLSTQGFHVYTYDYRGIGASRPSRMASIQADMRDWAILDMDAVISLIMTTHSQSKLIIIGHSVGGQLIGFSRLAKKAEAFVMIAAQTPYVGNYERGWMRFKLNIFCFLPLSPDFFLQNGSGCSKTFHGTWRSNGHVGQKVTTTHSTTILKPALTSDRSSNEH